MIESRRRAVNRSRPASDAPRSEAAAARVRLAVTMGDPGGIGPEVVLKAVANRRLARAADVVLVGDPEVWRDTAARLDLRLVREVRQTSALIAAHRRPGPPRNAAAAAARGEAAYAAIVEAVRLVQSGAADAVVTAPIAKAHLNAAGHDFPGHTELLAHLAGDVPVRMMMAAPGLRVVLATIHVRLAEVPRRLDRDGLVETLAITDRSLRRHFGVRRPRIGVAGLNPHAGEGGLFGDEEIRVIAPAVRVARRRGIDARGPMAADGLFATVGESGSEAAYDALVCMYHDQGLAAFKFVHFADGVNVTLGLPFVRTSPDHGTAFDIAGSGRADARSMLAALEMAATAVSRPGALRRRAR